MLKVLSYSINTLTRTGQQVMDSTELCQLKAHLLAFSGAFNCIRRSSSADGVCYVVMETDLLSGISLTC